MSSVQTIGVIGAGQMGAGIAHVAAMSGFRVILTDISVEALERGVAGIEKNMRRGVKSLGKKLDKGQLTQEEHDAKVAALNTQIDNALANIQTSTDLGAHAAAQLVIEAATENVDLKNRIFQELSEKRQTAPSYAQIHHRFRLRQSLQIPIVQTKSWGCIS